MEALKKAKYLQNVEQHRNIFVIPGFDFSAKWGRKETDNRVERNEGKIKVSKNNQKEGYLLEKGKKAEFIFGLECTQGNKLHVVCKY